MKRYDTTANFISNHVRSGGFPAGEVVEMLGYTSAGDQGAALWKSTGLTITASQTVIDTNDIKISDASGNEFELVHVGIIDLNALGGTGGAYVTIATNAGLTWSQSFTSIPSSGTINYNTVSDMINAAGLSAGYTIQTAEFSTGNGGGGVYDVVLTTSVTPNGANIIQGVADTSISFVLRVGDKPDFKQFGGVGDGSTNNDTVFGVWLDYLIANDVEGVANDGIFVLNSATQKTINNGLKLYGNATFKAGGSNRANMIRLTGCQDLFSMDGLTIDGNDICASPFRVENENSTPTTQGFAYFGPLTRFINAKNSSPDTNTVTGNLTRGGFSGVIFEGEIDGADDDRTSGGVTEGLTATHFTTAADDWVKNTVVTGKARFKNVKNSNTVLADADGLKVDAPVGKIATLTVQPGARFENCKGRAIKSQVVINSINDPSIYRSEYDGLSEINLQYAGGTVSGAKIHHDGTRTDTIISVTERLAPDNAHCTVLNNELTVTGTPSSDTRAMVQFNVTDATVKSQGITVRDNKVKGSIEHMFRWIVGNQVDENRAIVDGNWAETVSGTFLDLSVQGSSPAQPNIVFTNNGCQNGCTGATGGSSLLVEYERNNHNITTLASEPYELTVAAGVIQVYAGTHKVDTESNAATDDLDTINTDGRGQDEWLTLKAETNARVVTVKHATGNIRLAGGADFALDDVRDSLVLAYNTELSEWNEISRMSIS